MSLNKAGYTLDKDGYLVAGGEEGLMAGKAMADAFTHLGTQIHQKTGQE